MPFPLAEWFSSKYESAGRLVIQIHDFHDKLFSYTVSKGSSNVQHSIRVAVVLGEIEGSWIEVYSTANEDHDDGKWRLGEAHLMRRASEFRVHIVVNAEVGPGSQSYVALDNINFVECDRPYPASSCTDDEFQCPNGM